MTARDLDATIYRKGRPEDTFDLLADPDDTGLLRDTLQGWLTGRKWSKGKWDQFELVVRYAGENKVRAKVRA
jgi:hypothetical protein